MSVQIADLVASLRGEDSNFTAMLTRASAGLTGFEGGLGHALGGVTLLDAGIAALATGALVSTIKAASDFNTQLTQVQNNTTMTASDVGIMRAAVLNMATESNAPLDQLTTGFMHISNLGFSARDAVNVLQVAMESASSTGGNTADVAEVLALQLHEFGLKATDAGRAMDVLHLAAALGNSTLEEFATNTSKATAMAANMHVPLVQVDSALSALTRHMDLAQANTALSGLLSKIVAPSAGAVKELKALGKASGIDLVSDFSSAGLKAKGLTGVLADLQTATHGNTTELLKVIPAMRGGLAAMVLTGTGAKDYKDILGQLTEAMAGKLTPTAAAFARSQKTVGYQMGQLSNIAHVLAIDFGTVLLPAVTKVAAGLVPIAQALVAFTNSHQGLVTEMAKGVAAIAAFFTGMTTIKLSLTAAKFAIGPLVSLLGTLAAPLVAVGAAVAVFADAWNNDFGGIREKTAKVWNDLQPIFSTLAKTFGDMVSAFKSGGISGAITAMVSDLKNIGPLLKPLGKDLLSAFQAMPAALGGVLNQIGALKDKIDFRAVIVQLGHLKDAVMAVVAPGVKAGWSDFIAGLQQLGHLKDTVDFSKIFGAVGNATAPLKAQLAKWGQEFSNWIGPAATEFLKNWPFLLNKVLDTIGNAAGPILGKLATWAAQFVAWIVPHLPEITKRLLLISAAITLFIAETAVTIGNKIVVWAVQMTAWVVTHALPALQKVWPQFTAGLWDLLRQGAHDLFDHLGEWAGALANWVPVGMAKLRPLIQSISTQIIGWLGDTGHILWNAGANIIGGLIGGIESKLSDLKNELGKVTSLIPSWKGPADVDAKLLHGSGQLIMQGLLDGMTSKQGALHATLAGITTTIRQMGTGLPPTPGAGLTPAGAGLQGPGGLPLQLQIVMDGKTLTTAVLDNMKQGQYYRVGLV